MDCDHCANYSYREDYQILLIENFGEFVVCDQCLSIVKKMLVPNLEKCEVIIQNIKTQNETKSYFTKIDWDFKHFKYGMKDACNFMHWAHDLEDLTDMFRYNSLIWSVTKEFIAIQKEKLQREEKILIAKKLKLEELKSFPQEWITVTTVKLSSKN